MILPKNQSQINIESEIAPLKKVLIHTPGPEVECMAPEDIGKYLFHGVIFLKDLLKDYSVFKNVLSSIAQVYEIKQCLSEVFENPVARESCLNQVLGFYGKLGFKNELLDFDSNTLARVLIEGLAFKKSDLYTSLLSHVSENSYILKPLPNLYFARDSCVVVGKKLVSAYMTFSVRLIETILTKTIFEYHPDFKNEGLLIKSLHPNEELSLTLEGGDIHIWDKNLYIIGCGTRTNVAAIDAFIDATLQEKKLKKDNTHFHVIVVFLPKTASMIHLDMIFTRVSETQALVYKPALFGPQSFHTVKISVNGEKKHFKDMTNLMDALKSIGVSVDPVFCAGDQALIRQQREQWRSGTNSFAIAPGKIISYENEFTLKALEKAGFKIITGKDFIKDPNIIKNKKKLVVTINGRLLSQGGGGPRCMTCPILRENS